MRRKLFFMLPALLLLAGCASKNVSTSTPTAPTPPQLMVENAVSGLANAVNGTAKSAIVARDQGKCSQQDLNAIDAFLIPAANFGKAVDAEMKTADAWPVQKAKIITLSANAGLAQLKGRISPTAQAIITAVVAAVNQITTAVGGPQI